MYRIKKVVKGKAYWLVAYGILLEKYTWAGLRNNGSRMGEQYSNDWMEVLKRTEKDFGSISKEPSL